MTLVEIEAIEKEMMDRHQKLNEEYDRVSNSPNRGTVEGIKELQDFREKMWEDFNAENEWLLKSLLGES